MGYRKIPIVNGEFYHVFNRGNSRQEIFFSEDDYAHFAKLLYLCNSTKKINFRDDIVDKKINAWDVDRGETLVSIGAWVLMPNHFHIYMTSPKDGLLGDENNISLFMRKLGTAYSKYINVKYKRVGSLFEGRFKAINVNSDKQAKYVFSYIHLNPVKLIDKNWKANGLKNLIKTKNFLENYKWSSYLDFKGVVRLENKILDVEAFPDYFKKIKDFDTEIMEWLTYEDDFPKDRLLGR